MKKSPRIIALTTDPYNNIYGYSLVFFRLFDYIKKNNSDVEVTLISNDGLSSEVVGNNEFKLIYMNRNQNILFKTTYLTYSFVRESLKYPKDSIIVTNAEIPEILAGLILKLKFKKVFTVLQDDRVRYKTPTTIFVCKLRVLLLSGIKNIIFTNKYTMNNFKETINKIYIGNPIFTE